MMLELVDADGAVLDTIRLDDAGLLVYDTGEAGEVIEALRARTPDSTDRAVFEALAAGGWSNGYATIRPA
ncbi:hypothetical protein FXF51_56810 [Nonomuraea sp. PA05]|uniref:hypothetical protein n=1 Tax=Nonomuraea sp. PA05 TaxID=2604466 RepID=UPI0011DC302F|nr:hypothetical protein [Nonomuraea sp. PA05]TYB50244.1 hypothetical protein FXF51_56810 [Nonomuraea sp. PA05]